MARQSGRVTRAPTWRHPYKLGGDSPLGMGSFARFPSSGTPPRGSDAKGCSAILSAALLVRAGGGSPLDGVSRWTWGRSLDFERPLPSSGGLRSIDHREVVGDGRGLADHDRGGTILLGR